jgi:hypothetical protein
MAGLSALVGWVLDFEDCGRGTFDILKERRGLEVLWLVELDDFDLVGFDHLVSFVFHDLSIVSFDFVAIGSGNSFDDGVPSSWQPLFEPPASFSSFSSFCLACRASSSLNGTRLGDNGLCDADEIAAGTPLSGADGNCPAAWFNRCDFVEKDRQARQSRQTYRGDRCASIAYD